MLRSENALHTEASKGFASICRSWGTLAGDLHVVIAAMKQSQHRQLQFIAISIEWRELQILQMYKL